MSETTQAGGGAGGFQVDGQPVTVIRFEAHVKRYEAEDVARMQRPSLNSFTTDTPEYYRWYEYGGVERVRPLDHAELIDYLHVQRGYTPEEAQTYVSMQSLAREGDRQLWDHLISEKRNPSPLGSASTIENIDLVFRNGSTIVATQKNLSSEEAKKILGDMKMRRIMAEIANELHDGNKGEVIKGRLDEAEHIARGEVGLMEQEKLIVELLEKRSFAHEDAYLAAKAPALASLPNEPNAKLAELNKRDVEPYTPEEMKVWVNRDLRDLELLFVQSSDRFDEACLTVAANMQAAPAYKSMLDELSPDMAKIIGEVEAENERLIAVKEASKEMVINIEKVAEPENTIARGIDHEMSAEPVSYEGTALLSDGTTQKFIFEVSDGADNVEIQVAARNAWIEIAMVKAAQAAAKHQEQAHAQVVQRLNNEAVRREEERASEEPEKGRVGSTDITSVVPEKIQQRFLHVDGKYYFPDEKLAFSDMTNKLRAHEEHHEVVNALVDIAKARGWDKLTVRGSEEFRKQVWHRASVLGIEVSGYKPTDIEKARLAAELEKMGKGKPEQAATVNEIEKGIVQEKVADKPVSNVVPLRNFEGSLVEHGAAPYQFDKKEKQNYYVKLKTDQGEVKTVWGVDLERAITESGAQAGERIALQFLGKQKVEVMVNVKDAAGNVVGQEKALKDRNTWNVEKAEAFLTKDPKEVVKAHPELAPAYGTVAAAEKFAEANFQQPTDRERFVAGVKKVLGQKIEQGQELPAPKIKSVVREAEKNVGNQRGRRVPAHDAIEIER